MWPLGTLLPEHCVWAQLKPWRKLCSSLYFPKNQSLPEKRLTSWPGLNFLIHLASVIFIVASKFALVDCMIFLDLFIYSLCIYLYVIAIPYTCNLYGCCSFCYGASRELPRRRSTHLSTHIVSSKLGISVP